MCSALRWVCKLRPKDLRATPSCLCWKLAFGVSPTENLAATPEGLRTGRADEAVDGAVADAVGVADLVEVLRVGDHGDDGAGQRRRGVVQRVRLERRRRAAVEGGQRAVVDLVVDLRAAGTGLGFSVSAFMPVARGVEEPALKATACGCRSGCRSARSRYRVRFQRQRIRAARQRQARLRTGRSAVADLVKFCAQQV